MFRRVAICGLVLVAALSLAPEPTPAASKEIMELQRDVAGLQESLRQLKESQDKQLAVLTTLVQQAIDTSKSSTTGVAIIQNNLQQSLRDMESKVSAPVAGLSSRLDSIDQDMRTMQQSVSDLNVSINKQQAQLSDLNKAVTVLESTPPPPPPAANPASGPGGVPGIGGGGGGAVAAAPAPEAPCPPASQLYPAANSDRTAGNYDLAIKEYADYLRCYGNLPLAPNAQFYIGTSHMQQGDNESAVQDFDAVLEKYPDFSKTPDVLYAKGLALVKLGRLTDGGTAFNDVIKRFPKSDYAPKACDQRKAMGLNCPVPRAASSKKK